MKEIPYQLANIKNYLVQNSSFTDWHTIRSDQILFFPFIPSYYPPLLYLGSAVAWWLMPRTPDPEVVGSSPTRVKPCCVLEQGTFTPPKVLVIPRKRWLRPNMTEKLFTGTLRINQPTNQPNNHCCICTI